MVVIVAVEVLTRAGEQRVEEDDEEGAKLGAEAVDLGSGEDVANAEESDECMENGEGEVPTLLIPHAVRFSTRSLGPWGRACLRSYNWSIFEKAVFCEA